MNTLPIDVSTLLVQLSLSLLLTTLPVEDLSNEFDDLFPEFDYQEARRYYNFTVEAIQQTDPQLIIQAIWRLGYPDIATTARKFFHDHKLLSKPGRQTGNGA
jgi:hypothetical protein